MLNRAFKNKEVFEDFKKRFDAAKDNSYVSFEDDFSDTISIRKGTDLRYIEYETVIKEVEVEMP